jgi:lysophospholipase L1-like esterase
VGKLKKGRASEHNDEASIINASPQTGPNRFSLISLLVLVVAGALPLLGLEFLGIFGAPAPEAIFLLVCIWMLLLLMLLRKREGWLVVWPRRLFLLIFAAAASCFVLEFVLEPFVSGVDYEYRPAPGSPAEMLLPDPELETVLCRGFKGTMEHSDFSGVPVAISAHGFRDRPWSAEGSEEEGVLRVLGLGDSFTFGLGVQEEETFLRRLEALGIGQEIVHTINLAVPGYGPVHELLCLQKHVDRIEPDLVVMAVFPGNDLSDSLRLFRQMKKIPGMEHIPLVTETKKGPGSRKEESSTAEEDSRKHIDEVIEELAQYKYWMTSSKLGYLILPPLRRLAARIGLADPRLVYNDLLIRSCALKPDPSVRSAMQIVITAAELANKTCASRNARFAVMFIPHKILVDRAMFDRYFESSSYYKRQNFSPDILHETLVKMCEAQDIPVLDLLLHFRALYEQGEKLYHDEGHWNSEGHRSAAERLSEWLWTKWFRE